MAAPVPPAENVNDSPPKYAASKTMLAIAPFVIGGSSGCVATTILHPVDMVKVRMQLLGEGAKGRLASSPLALGKAIAAEGSLLRLYDGLSAAYLRQLTYTTLRIGFFDTAVDAFGKKAKREGRAVTFMERAIAALGAGALSSFMANPAEVALIRMQSDGMKPREQRANYRSVFDALLRTGREEGIKGLWKGSYPTVIRAMSTNFGQLAFFSESKSQLKRHTNFSEQGQTFTASIIAGFAAAFFSLPFDFLKTRLQRQGSRADGSPPYRGMIDCARQVIKNEGILRFYRGLGMYTIRIAPHSIITLVVADNLRALVGIR